MPRHRTTGWLEETAMNQIRAILETMDYGTAPEASDIVRDWLHAHRAGFGHFIDGRFSVPEGATLRDVRDPAHDAPLALVVQGTAADVDAAVGAARRAFPAWSALPGHMRARHLYALARHVQKRERFLSVLETLDNGKPIRESRDIDIPLVARHFIHHAGWAELIDTEFPDHGPVGVCGQIIPWNFPLLMLAWKIAPALAAGNTVVLKPAEDTPLTALAFAAICQEAGLPPGVVNIVCGDGSTGSALVAHLGIDKIAFTGSTDVGRMIRVATAGSGKKLSLELGGKSPFIVFEDADLDSAVEGVVDAIWFNQGQVCCAGSRILVQEGIAPRFHAKLRARMETLRIGDPLDKSIDVGAIVSKVQLERIRSIVEQGRSEGNTIWQASGPVPETGCFYPPTLITDVSPASTVVDVEIFGPVATSMTFRTPEEAIALANNTRYGLAASIWSENINLALDAAARVRAGVIWVNGTNMFDAAAGFGGYKESGFGREGGREGMHEYLVPLWAKDSTPDDDSSPPLLSAHLSDGGLPGPVADRPTIDRTAKLYIGGKQARPDSGYSYAVTNADGTQALAGLGNRKDIRNGVEAATKASGWSAATAHNRAQVMYYLAENLAARADDFTTILVDGGVSATDAGREVEASISRIFWYAAQADKYDGQVHATRSRHVTLAMNEPFGVMGILCPDRAPLLAFVSMVMPAIAMGNRVVVVPSPLRPLAATEFYQVLDTSDVPGGVVNIVTGERDVLGKTLAEHDDVAALWYAGSREGSAAVERASAGNLKPTWVDGGRGRDWFDPQRGQGRDYLRRAVQVKNIWIPYGE
jgi:aldehyde dehydrogenase (NAD+)